MSQRGSAPRPPSRRASRSPSRDAKPSPSARPGVYHRDEDAAEGPQRPGGASAAAGEDSAEHATPRTIGVHNILNPYGPRSSISGGRLPPQHHGESSSPSSSLPGRLPGHEPSPRAAPVPMQEQQQNPPRFGTPTPVPAMRPGPPPFLDRGSPSLSHQYPGFGPGPRRILTPRSPRVASLGRALGRRSAEMQPSLPYPPPSAFRSGGSQADMFPMPAPPGQALPTFHPSSHLPVSAPGTTPPRSASQPILGNAPPFGPAQNSGRDMGGNRELQERAPTFSSPLGFPPGLAPARSLGALGPSGGESYWSSALMSSLQSGGQRGMGPSKAQHVLTIIPNSGEEIHVPVDVHQASRQADEKRLRNAGASARFRARKKMKEKETQGENQRLEAQNRELEREAQELRVERDFYRGERDRLRDIIYRTPGIHELADHAPPSPRSARGGGLLGGPRRGGSLGGHLAADSGAGTPMLHHQAHPPPYAGGGDPSLEPPSRRRRTDPAPEFTTPSYGPPPILPNTLPPMPNPGYRAAPASLPSSPGNGRLPPLRLEQAMASPSSEQHPTPGAPPAILPPPQYPPYGRVPHETGWATAPPRGPHEGGPPR